MVETISLAVCRLWCGLVSSLVLLGFALTQPASAESVISIDKASLSYAYRIGVNTDKLAALAAKRCQELGGQACQPAVSCRNSGFGAIAIDSAKGAIGAVCGQSDEATAREGAGKACVTAGGTAVACKVTGIFKDETPAFTVPRAFFAGEWAQSCGGVRSYRFNFVDFNAFQVTSCSCKLRQHSGCQLQRCGAVKGVYTPGEASETFVAPTFGKRIAKREQTLVMTNADGSRVLRRCN